jgi:phage baseplate assembly protein W
MAKISPKFPIKILSDGIAIDSHSEDDIKSAIRFNLKNIILTNPGERIMNSSFGAGILELLFSQPTPDLVTKIKSRIIKQVNLWAPYVIIRQLDISYNGENSINIAIAYEVPEIDVNDYFDITTSV